MSAPAYQCLSIGHDDRPTIHKLTCQRLGDLGRGSLKCVGSIGAQGMIGDLIEQCARRLEERVEPRLLTAMESVSRRGENPLPLYELATLCRRHGHTDLWRALLDCAVALPHDSYQQIYHRGRAKLLLDDWSGWHDLESRIYDPSASYLASRAVRVLRFNVRAWDGRENIQDKSLYVIADGGFGDCLQMTRYIPTLADRAGHLVLCVRPELADLIRQAYGDRVTLTLRGVEDNKLYDRYAWMMSLPALIGGPPPFTTFPGVTPSRRPTTPEPRAEIGICWTGDINWTGDAERSLPLDSLSPLLARADMRWFSLQTGAAAETIKGDARISSPAAPLYSFVQTAALAARLDAIVTVDTAIAHLAGALGVPTWVLLSADADPRWGTGSTTHWYPYLRLVRQRAVGDWTDALAEVERELETCVRQATPV
jgi:hypothetical protein